MDKSQFCSTFVTINRNLRTSTITKMGHVLRKKTNTAKESNVLKHVNISEIENVLYRPISEFSWKDATQAELRREAIASYGKRFVL